MANAETSKFSIFNSKRQLDPIETDKAIRELFRLMGGVQRNEAWPIGSIFITITPDDPADLLGYGEWIPFGQGRTIISVDNNNYTPAERIG